MPLKNGDAAPCRSHSRPVGIERSEDAGDESRSVIKIGAGGRLHLNRRFAGEFGLALFLVMFGELDDQDGVFAGQPDEHDYTDRVKMLISLAALSRLR